MEVRHEPDAVRPRVRRPTAAVEVAEGGDPPAPAEAADEEDVGLDDVDETAEREVARRRRVSHELAGEAFHQLEVDAEHRVVDRTRIGDDKRQEGEPRGEDEPGDAAERETAAFTARCRKNTGTSATIVVRAATSRPRQIAAAVHRPPASVAAKTSSSGQ